MRLAACAALALGCAATANAQGAESAPRRPGVDAMGVDQRARVQEAVRTLPPRQEEEGEEAGGCGRAGGTGATVTLSWRG